MRHQPGILRTAGIAALLALAPAGAAAAEEPQLFVITYSPGPGWIAGKPMAQQKLREHAAYYARLAADGRALGAGAFLDADGGMAIVRATKPEVDALIAADPAVVNGVFRGTVRPWRPSYGVPPLVAARPR